MPQARQGCTWDLGSYGEKEPVWQHGANSMFFLRSGAFFLQDKEMVKLLLEMKVGLDTVMNEAFGKDERFGHALKDAFEHFVNQRANRYLAFSQLPGNVMDLQKKA